MRINTLMVEGSHSRSIGPVAAVPNHLAYSGVVATLGCCNAPAAMEAKAAARLISLLNSASSSAWVQPIAIRVSSSSKSIRVVVMSRLLNSAVREKEMTCPRVLTPECRRNKERRSMLHFIMAR